MQSGSGIKLPELVCQGSSLNHRYSARGSINYKWVTVTCSFGIAGPHEHDPLPCSEVITIQSPLVHKLNEKRHGRALSTAQVCLL